MVRPLYSPPVAIYTKRGDLGETDLFGGPRVAKDHIRVDAYGAVDELNAVLGACAASTEQPDVEALTRSIQSTLFELGSYLASPDPARRKASRIPEPSDSDVALLEARIDAFEAELTPLRRFILPGGTHAAAAFHLARTVCRRAERRVVALHHTDPLGAAALRYLNRLSDLLFVMARVENRRAGLPEVEWKGREG
jgi:cob(I)alamin adenosyltransferase